MTVRTLAACLALALAATPGRLRAQTPPPDDIKAAAAAAAAASVPDATPVPTPAKADAPAKVVPTDATPSQPGLYTGAASCAASGCHGSPLPVANANVHQNEYDTWLHAGKPTHATAYEVLFSERSRSIARLMKLDKPASQARICLDCHSTNVPKPKLAGAIDLADGVQCEACHGPAGGWRAQHSQQGWKHEDSVRLGMVDLRDLRERGRTCLGCHLGDARKTVDHELLAAGHPILALELDNFTESRLSPPHWKLRKEKSDPESYRGPETHGVRAWAVGQAVAFSEGLRLLSSQARSEKWPEFSVLQCSACHHDLRSGAWRQKRGYAGRPGLPPFSPARWAVLKHVVSEVAPDRRVPLEAEVDELASLVASMRNAERVAAKADALAEGLSEVVDKAGAARWDEARVRRLMAAITADDASFGRGDRQSAEQAMYALVSLGTFLARNDPKLVRSGMMRTVDDLFAQLDKSSMPDEFAGELFAETLRRLGEAIR